MNSEKIVIIGSGAAGLFCAYLLGRCNKKVAVFEKLEKPGRKLAITGGGYCNFSNLAISAECYCGDEAKNFVSSMLACYKVDSAKDFIRKLGYDYVEKNNGCLFLDKPAGVFVRALEKECRKAAVEFLYNHYVDKIDVKKKLVIIKNEFFKASRIIMAQGSNAGITNNEPNVTLLLAKQTGHKIKNFTAALVPLEYDRNSRLKSMFSSLAGISVNARLVLATKHGDREFSGAVLFTHYGLSGPAILDCSLYWENEAILKIDFLPGYNFEKLLDDFPRQTPMSTSRGYLPERLVKILFSPDLLHIKNGQLSRSQRKLLADQIHHYLFSGLHKGAIKRAEVCLSGMQSN